MRLSVSVSQAADSQQYSTADSNKESTLWHQVDNDNSLIVSDVVHRAARDVAD